MIHHIKKKEERTHVCRIFVYGLRIAAEYLSLIHISALHERSLHLVLHTFHGERRCGGEIVENGGEDLIQLLSLIHI